MPTYEAFRAAVRGKRVTGPIRDPEEEKAKERAAREADQMRDASDDDDDDDDDMWDDVHDGVSTTSRRTGGRRAWRNRRRKDKDMDEAALREEEEEEVNFPDEIQTPEDVAARIRFQKYRGLKSFRTSPWDPKENLPYDYAKIFTFVNFRKTSRQVLARHSGVEPDQYVTVHVRNIAAAQFAEHPRHMPLILSGLHRHEQKISVVNFSVQRAISYSRPVRNKTPLLFHVGFRRYMAEPTFSEATTNADKFKMERFFRGPAVATVLAPICYPPSPLVLTTDPTRTFSAAVPPGLTDSCFLCRGSVRARWLWVAVECGPRSRDPQEDRAHGHPCEDPQAPRRSEAHVLLARGRALVQACRDLDQTRPRWLNHGPAWHTRLYEVQV